MSQKHIATINVDNFIKGDFTLKTPENFEVLGSSALIYVKKTENGLDISSPYNEEDAYIKNFSITLIPPKEKEDKFLDNKFVCTLNWTPKEDRTKYLLYKNNILIEEQYNTNAKYNFENEENGTYVFRIDVLEQNNFIEKSTKVNQYVYPYLDIPIYINYKYYFYYYIENKDKDIFNNKMLTVLPIDSYASKVIEKGVNQTIEKEQYTFIEHSFSTMKNKEVFTSDEYIYFTENTYSKENCPPYYFILKLFKTPGSKYGLLPEIKYIDVYIEEILENDENLNTEFEGGVNI